MPLTIREVAEINSGLVVSRKKSILEKETKKIYKQLNLRSINKNGYIDINELENLPAKELIDDNYLTHKGDIIVRLTDPFTAVYVTENFENIVVSSNFCIIRCGNRYSGLFLAYYINSDNAKKILCSNLQGSVMKNINMSALANLEIPNTPLNKQVMMGKLIKAQVDKIIVLEKIMQLEEKKQKELIKKLSNM